jgi:polyphosphate kinase 2 (PPK2 family)
MLENALVNKNKSVNYKDMTKQLEQNLSVLQQKIRDKKLPVIILLEGWGASGKGQLISDIIKMLDPRFFKVYSTMPANEYEKRYPLMKRFWANIPEYGTMSILDRSWYQELAIAKLEEGISEEEYERRVRSVNIFERQLTDDGCLIIKFFLHISRQEQKKRFVKLKEDSATKWRVTELDKKRNKNYDIYYKQFDDMLVKTDTPYCRWKIIDTTDRQFTRFQVFNVLVSQIANAVNSEPQRTPVVPVETLFKLVPEPKLADVRLEGKELQPSKYFDELKKAQKELSRLGTQQERAEL